MKLSDLLSDILEIPKHSDKNITGLALDSRQVQPGDLFFACKGTKLDGSQFINDALQKGAVAVLTDATGYDAPVFTVPNLSHQIGSIASRFFANPSKKLRMIGITGTNGKTSCSHFIAAALSQVSKLCGVIGTLGNGLFGNIQPSTLTTPDAITLQKILAEFLEVGVKIVAMEVSSHSLDQGRVSGIHFEVGVFTNLTRDHLDYHPSMEAYGAAKKKLFEHCKYAVINADDEFGRELLASDAHHCMFAYATQKHALPSSVPVILADRIHLDGNGVQAHVSTPWGEGHLHAALIGQFNLSNMLAVLTTLCLLKIPFATALNCLAQLKPVDGRMQALGGKNKPLVVVDYAHTPDALEKVLTALRAHCEGKLYCLFGCGGDRDRGKRPLMAKIAEKYADYIVVTDDNPRTENPTQIVADIMPGFTDTKKVIVQHDRSKAIQDIIQFAGPSDCVLIAGKGAETYQQIGHEKFPFSDVEKVKENLT